MKLARQQCWYGPAMVGGAAFDLQTRGTRCVAMAPISLLTDHYKTASTAKESLAENLQDSARKTVTHAMQKALGKPVDFPECAKWALVQQGQVLYIPSGMAIWEMAQEGDSASLAFRIPAPVVGMHAAGQKDDLMKEAHESKPDHMKNAYESMLFSYLMLLAGKMSLVSRWELINEHLQKIGLEPRHAQSAD